MIYAVAGLVFVLVVGIGAAFIYGRKSGRESQQTGDLKKTVAIREKQLDEANKPRDPKSVADSLHDGSF